MLKKEKFVVFENLKNLNYGIRISTDTIPILIEKFENKRKVINRNVFQIPFTQKKLFELIKSFRDFNIEIMYIKTNNDDLDLLINEAIQTGELEEIEEELEDNNLNIEYVTFKQAGNKYTFYNEGVIVLEYNDHLSSEGLLKKPFVLRTLGVCR
ncbi:hypothetical protein EVU91_13075 [Macrococcoides bohemicum]|uniref:hypothetical protein n=1 Tax=Macrococcoides bohemicum TaxID=1903056 RepID=UPI00105A7EE0|nr:hypothetical protein [Macrococcus bohemicus]TDL33508.1 hypothetical protein EVU91_13075 [Macrococcus bohemicus]